MSDNAELQAIHSRTCGLFEELYDARGQPDELDDTFLQEYFNIVQNSLGAGFETESDEVRGPHKTDAKLQHYNSGLVDLVIPSKSEKFHVSSATATKNITGTSQRMGSSRGKGTYLMTNVKGIPNITVKSGNAIVTFVGMPNAVNSESGSGEWVKF